MNRLRSDDEVIDVVELLVLALESCRLGDALVSAALARIAGGDAEMGELRSDTARVVAMLARVAHLAERAGPR